MPQTGRTRPTLKSLSWSRKNTKTVQVTGVHVYTAGSFYFDIQIEGVRNAVIRENWQAMAADTEWPAFPECPSVMITFF